MNVKKQEKRNLDESGRLCLVLEAANYLALSRSKIYELMDAGDLAYVKIGRSRRIPITAVLELIEANTIKR